MKGSHTQAEKMENYYEEPDKIGVIIASIRYLEKQASIAGLHSVGGILRKTLSDLDCYLKGEVNLEDPEQMPNFRDLYNALLLVIKCATLPKGQLQELMDLIEEIEEKMPVKH